MLRGTGGRAGRGGGRTRGRSGDQDDDRNGQGGQLGGQGTQVCDQGRGQGNCRNQNGDAINDNIWGDYDGKGGAIVYTHWIEKMESVHDMSGCRDSDVSLCTDTPYLLDGYGVLGKSSLFFFVDQSIVYGVSLMWIRRILQSQAMVF
ncbi:hypothetical protein Tco_0977552 [Tanacetum coccineum]|uniref:Reverse transcriptase domain-containing protein n=1 Tax=Tanacetum coccineum TaxID=301880 RepID=A0ABQ5EKG3_9ASTR